jgi:hypothetical protein
VIYGALGATDQQTRLPVGTCFFRGVKAYTGITIFDYNGNPRLGLPPKPGAVNRAKEFITKGLAARKLTPKIDRVFNCFGRISASSPVHGNERPEWKDYHFAALIGSGDRPAKRGDGARFMMWFDAFSTGKAAPIGC